ncbi:RanBP2-type domain-containing protein [Haematococcus lacustris]|uniref:RanBP2-type domain-containing protein n=1 Tax=Haematococcus lacustris TaxID=44745 RepID=A0A699YBW4_HAELA|nr:RanBP2-type domain-containing protein [Haematococcus lacustris]
MLARGLAGSFCGTAAANEAAAVCILPRQGYMLAHMRALHSGTVVLQRSWAIRAGMQPPAAELALPSMQEAAPHGAPPDLQGMWLAFLRILHHQGHFPQTGLDREAAIQEQREVKAGLLAFARSRPDLLMALDTSDVVAVAEVPLTSASSQSERKVTNADRRLKASFAPASPAPSQDPSVTSHRPPALQDATAAELSAPHGGQARVQGSEGGGVQHASTQDLVRVVWSWVAFPPHVIEGHSLAPDPAGPGATPGRAAAASPAPGHPHHG